MDAMGQQTLAWGGSSGDMEFSLSSSRGTKWMVHKPKRIGMSVGTSAMAHTPATLTPRARKPAAFASLTASGSQSGSGNAGAKVPLFMLASAAESKKQVATDAPAWRVAAGNLAAGAVAGCSVEAALYPIDTIKTRLQAMIGGGGIKALLQSGGGKGLYAGVWGNLAGVAPASAIFISVYEPVKKAVEQSVSQDQQYLGAVLAGMAAGTASSLVRVPTEVIKQRLQTKEFAGAMGAISHIMSKEGVRGLYAGYGAFMLRDLPFDAIEFVVYEQLKKAWTAFNKRELHAHETSLIGAFAGGFTGVVTTPLDVLKTRMMVQGASGRYSHVFDAMVKIAREEGAAAFMKGWQPRLMWISLGGFVFFPVLEASKKFFAPPPAPAPAPVVEEDKKKKK
uniref:Mitochondrial carrier protein n=1 Tax=Chlamydomonas leiostraca TaxID=1034604 RepID=A0A7S0X188_9CHLO|eukprot:CAMPEP_0202862318 /NCGR_PEP_ID=MMETSP1391-20130828/3400_1 /ASSEMBLY_ACC=CAM_ASM_000867 /TAXON_ID=1034604 /ORGANISM="Chlamydomonas leiostraca, Strain SAG 11-49" /LENGTH=392 /DNA_ID=CAMNT_0049541833 /DNA_START=17 /DNA_END=1195 /DNA_ORIENTATION=-